MEKTITTKGSSWMQEEVYIMPVQKLEDNEISNFFANKQTQNLIVEKIINSNLTTLELEWLINELKVDETKKDFEVYLKIIKEYEKKIIHYLKTNKLINTVEEINKDLEWNLNQDQSWESEEDLEWDYESELGWELEEKLEEKEKNQNQDLDWVLDEDPDFIQAVTFNFKWFNFEWIDEELLELLKWFNLNKWSFSKELDKIDDKDGEYALTIKLNINGIEFYIKKIEIRKK